MATEDQRLHAQAVARLLLANAAHIGYTQARPMTTAKLYEQDLADLFAKAGKINPDCSEAVTFIARLAGWKDPNGLGFDGYGDTQTLYDHLPHFANIANVHLGTIVTFGTGNPDIPLSKQHVGIVIEEPNGADPLLFSHGSSAGPIQIRLSDYRRAEPWQTPVTFLGVSRL